MMLKHSLFSLMLILLTLSARPAQALDCAQADKQAQRVICASPQLQWLDRVYNDVFHQAVSGDPQRAAGLLKAAPRVSNDCASEACLREEYLLKLGQLYGARRDLSWQGSWWNTSLRHGSSAKITIGDASAEGFHFYAVLAGGIYQSRWQGEVRLYSGIGFSDEIHWGGDCAVIFIPLPDWTLRVRSDRKDSCRLLAPDGLTMDGLYVKSASDPRPPATLLSLGVLPDAATEETFRQLVGSDYPQFLATATDFTLSNDPDNPQARVVTLWVKGLADRQAAMIVTAPQGKIWALRIAPQADNQLSQHYFTTEAQRSTLPKSLARWRAQFSQP